MTTGLATRSSNALDPVALIRRSGVAASTQVKYIRVLLPYLDAGGNLLNAQALKTYADGLSASSRAQLRSAVSVCIKETQTRLEATVTPATLAEVQAAIMRLEAIRKLIRVDTRKGKKAHTWLSPKQVKALMDTCDDSLVGRRDRVVLGLLVGAGLRRAELAGLTWEHVTWQPVGDKMRTVLEVHGKGAKDRVVPISDRLAATLDDWQTTTDGEGYIARSLGMAQKLGESLSAVGIFQIVRRHGELIGVPTLAPHDLRRTYAQIGYDAGVPITQISALLGHSSVTTTQRYLDLELDLETTASDFVPL